MNVITTSKNTATEGSKENRARKPLHHSGQRESKAKKPLNTHTLTYLSREMATSVRTLAKTKMGSM